jgi:hypothetical protein
MKISQMPPLRRRMGLNGGGPTQLKSPTTKTTSALGAQTVKRTPSDAIHGDHVRAQGLIGGVEIALAVQMQVEIGDEGRETVRVIKLDFRAVPQAGPQAIASGVGGEGGRVQAMGVTLFHGGANPPAHHRGF